MIAPPSIRSAMDAPIDVPVGRLLNRLGHATIGVLSPRMRRQIEQATHRVRQCARPRMTWRAYPITIESGRVRINRSIALRSFRLARALRPCHTLHVYVVTLGRTVDRLVDHAMQSRPGFGVVVDAAASAAAESLVEHLHQVIADDLPPGETNSLPFSPGYCDWPLYEQRKIFGLLPDEPAGGVALSDDCLMRPRKSIAGVIGIGSARLLDEIPSPCVTCGRKDCPYRRE